MIFLFRFTGLTDSMRENFRLMSSLATETRLHPGKRIEKLLRFNERLNNVPAIRKELSQWNLQLDKKLLEVPGRELGSEKIFFGITPNSPNFVTPDKGDWAKLMHNKRCIIAPPLHNWVFIIMERDKGLAQVC